ncbi:hypothetical protein V8E54_009083 [Elaphomyces granulatus]|jgi:hypothetical protein
MPDETSVAASSPPASSPVEPVAGHDSSVEPAVGSADAAPETRTELEKMVTEDAASQASVEPETRENVDGVGDPPAANGTPASAKKATNAKRKSTGGVAEHKTKKLNRKKSQPRITHLDANPGNYYLARLKSYPPWPAIICDEEMLPQTLLNTRPVTTKQADGSYRESYADGGKRAHERTFPIMFLETNEFAWIPNTDLTPLDTETCKDVSEKSKTKPLLAAYKVAAENHDLQYFKSLLADHQRAVQLEAEEREAKAAAKAAAKAQKDEKKKKRKSIEVAEEPEDGELGEDQEAGKKVKSAKKRKKDVESDGENEKPVKTPKTTTKLKLTTPKTPATAETTKKAAATPKSTKAKMSSKAAKVSPSDEETAVETPKEPEKQIDPQEAKAKKQKEILFIRHKLQKGFLSRDQAPKEDEMAIMSNYIVKLEAHAELEVSIIRATKINKVLKAIIKLDSIPKDEEYQFRRRSIDILAKWKNLLDSDIPPAGPATPAPAPAPAPAEAKSKDSKPRANGVHRQDEGDDSGKSKADTDKANKESKETEGAQEASMLDADLDESAPASAVVAAST